MHAVSNSQTLSLEEFMVTMTVLSSISGALTAGIAIFRMNREYL